MRRNTVESFAEHVRTRRSVVVDGDCWLWTGGKSVGGYGVIMICGKNKRAHRVSYEAFAGPIPEGLELDHLCRNRACVNPAHLEPVTGLVNIRRGNGFAARNARKTRCIHGHSDWHSYVRRDDGLLRRECMTCKRTRPPRDYKAERARRTAESRSLQEIGAALVKAYRLGEAEDGATEEAHERAYALCRAHDEKFGGKR